MTMAMDADVRLLIGVARGGADGDSEALIRNCLLYTSPSPRD